jgi:hypothetical protein
MKKHMTYSRLLKAGHLVSGIESLTGENSRYDNRPTTWFCYGVVTRLTKHNKSIILYWINHGTRETCPYVDVFGDKIDPRTAHYAKHREEELIASSK